MGLETEYAIRFADAGRPGVGISHAEVYHAAASKVAASIPTANADYVTAGKFGQFIANGTAMWFERCRFYGGPGLIEGCTAEATSPRDVLAGQRALDKLLGDAVQQESACPAALLKNCCDPTGISYGAQENYEVEFASGWQRTAWKVGILIWAPLSVLTIIAMVLVLMAITVISLPITLPVYYLKAIALSPAQQLELRNYLFGGSWFAGGEKEAPYPLWMETIGVQWIRLACLPMAVYISLLTSMTRLRRTQKQLLPFLLSRIIVVGSGSVSANGVFQMAQKAPSRTRQFFLFLIDHDRPIYSINNLIKYAIMIGLKPEQGKSVFKSRQRLQISIGDSNLCEEAEYLKIGCTALVLDAIESGFLTEYPVIRTPLWALRKLNKDTSLTQTVKTSRGPMTAVQLQRFYFERCRDYLNSVETEHLEAEDIMRRWADVLNQLKTNRDALIGRIDWITKQHLLDAANQDDLASRRKIDLKYHELSAAGYFAKLHAAGHTRRIVEPAEIERAMRSPPAHSPAVQRCHYIREFANHIAWINWDAVQLDAHYGSRVVRFTAAADTPS